MKFNLELKFGRKMFYLLIIFLYIMVFYLFIVRNINFLNEIKEDIENANARNYRLLEENKLVKEELATVEEKLQNLEDNSFELSNDYSAYFDTVPDLIYFIDSLAKKNYVNILSLKNFVKVNNLIKLPYEVEGYEQNIKNFLKDIEEDKYYIYILDKDLHLEIKEGNLLNISFNASTILRNKKEKKMYIDKNNLNLRDNLFYMNSTNKSYVKIGNKIINSKKSISISEEKRQKDEEEKQKELKKQAKKKKNTKNKTNEKKSSN